MASSRSPLPDTILCADDFAISRGTSLEIARLARRGSINAVSCMANMPGWPADARLLDGLGPDVQVGLHLVLASERPLGPLSCCDAQGLLPGPDRLLLLALTGQIDEREFIAEIDRQFVAFVAARGAPPDFVDAHQHTHVYPRLRRLFAAAVRRHAPGAWVRVPDDRLGAMLARPFRGKAIGSALQAAGLRRKLARAGIACNASFAGHYDFRGDYRARLDRFLRHGTAPHLIMCHPGSDDLPGDTIAAARVIEAAVLAEASLAQRLAALQEGASRPGSKGVAGQVGQHG